MSSHLNLVDAGAESPPLGELHGVAPGPRFLPAAAGLPKPAAANPRDLFSLVIGSEERRALIRTLAVVKDNWWLDPVEQHLLERLETLEHEPAA